MKKNLKLLYFSPTDTTKKIVTSIANSIDSDFIEYDITLPQNRTKPISFTKDDLVIIGVPTYAGRVPKILNDYFDRISASETLAVFIVTYGNRAYEDALLELKDIFTAKGFIGLAAGAFVAEHSSTKELATGRPDVNDLSICMSFGEEIKNRISKFSSVREINDLNVPGEFPYVVKPAMPPMAPVTENSCNSCGICAKHCPTGAISLTNFKEVDANKCLRCCSCIRRCPVSAKEITHEAYVKFHDMLITNFSSKRCEPELFIG